MGLISRSRGFSLIEVMVALGVMSIGGYFIMGMFKTGSMGQKTLLAQDDARLLTDNMANLLTDPWACAYTFGNGAPGPVNGVSPPNGALSPAVSADPITGSVNGGATAVLNIYDRNKNVQFTATLPPFAPPYPKFGNGGLQLYAILIGGTTPPIDPKTKMQRWVNTGSNTGTAFVQVDWLQTGGKGNSNGPQHLLRYFMVNVTSYDTTTNKINSCVAMGGTGGATLTGLANYLALWQSDSTLKESGVFQDPASAFIGIGTATPFRRLTVSEPAGTAVARIESPGAGFASDLEFKRASTGTTWTLSHYTDDNFELIRNSGLPGGSTPLTVTGAGKVGINTTSPGQMLTIAGDVGATAFYYTSDRRLKENVDTVDGLETILRLRGVKFSWIRDGKRDVGLIAQEVERVLPELVFTDPATGLKSIQYGNLVAPLIEAAKELKAENDELRARIDAIEAKLRARGMDK